MTDSELLAGFENGTLSGDSFSHREHVRTAWLYIGRYGLPDAIGRFTGALKQFAEGKGKPDLYHETVTWAYLFIIGERRRRGPEATWEEFAAANADLLIWKPSILDRFYTPETLWSEAARRGFVMPDRVE